MKIISSLCLIPHGDLPATLEKLLYQCVAFCFKRFPHVIILKWPILSKPWPISSMYGMFTCIYHTNQPNVGKYTILIHGSYGCCFRFTFLLVSIFFGILLQLNKPKNWHDGHALGFKSWEHSSYQDVSTRNCEPLNLFLRTVFTLFILASWIHFIIISTLSSLPSTNKLLYVQSLWPHPSHLKTISSKWILSLPQTNRGEN